jgi:glutathione S-transferase
MNFRRAPKPIPLDAEVQANIDRIVGLWEECRGRYGGDGDFLFGSFTIADAMFAPVVSRFHTYAVAVGAVAQAYMEAVMALPAWQEWTAAARAEPWLVAAYERD